VLRTRTLSSQHLDAKTLAGNQVVVLANVPQLTEPQIHALEGFVEQGGGLLFFPGSRTDSRWANQHLHRGGKGLLPAEMNALQARSAEPAGAPVGGGMGVASDALQHQVLEPFQQGGGALGEIRVQTWYSLQQGPATAGGNGVRLPKENRRSATVMLALENGEPLLLESKFGNGVVIQSASACGPAWSNLPTRPAFVPLMQRLAVHAGSAMVPSANLACGQPLTALLPAELADKQVSVRCPDGATESVTVRAGKPFAVAEFMDTRLPGVYQVIAPDGSLQLFAFNLSRSESNPERCSDEETATLASAAGASVSRTLGQLEAAQDQRSEGREVWRPLLWLTLACLFLEIIVQQRFAQRKGGGS
jgi:hypothetical protein